MVTTALSQLRAGVEVEVRTRFTATWAPGFEVAHVAGDRVHVRRRSDGVVLPVALGVDDVRPTGSRGESERGIALPSRRPA